MDSINCVKVKVKVVKGKRTEKRRADRDPGTVDGVALDYLLLVQGHTWHTPYRLSVLKGPLPQMGNAAPPISAHPRVVCVAIWLLNTKKLKMQTSYC